MAVKQITSFPIVTTTERNALTGVTSTTVILNVTTGQFERYNGSTWDAATGSTGGSGASTALSNLASTAVNASINPATDSSVSLGDITHRWNETYVVGGNYNQIQFRDPAAPGTAIAEIISSHADLDADIALVHTADVTSPLSYGVAVGTRFQLGGANSRGVTIRSGNTVDGTSGDVEMFSGFSTGTGSSGIMNLLSGSVTNGASGIATLSSGTATLSGGTTGNVEVFSGAVQDTISGQVNIRSGNANASGGNSGTASIYTGNTIDAASGDVNAFSGNAGGSAGSGGLSFHTGTTVNGSSGGVDIATGAPSGSGTSGGAQMHTGNTGSGTSGEVLLLTGNSSGGNSGHAIIQTGTAGGTRGNVKLDGLKVFLDLGGQAYYQSTYIDAYWETAESAIVADSSSVTNANGQLFIGTTDLATDSVTFSVQIMSGYNTSTTTSGEKTGGMIFASGYVTAGAGESGPVEIFSGDTVNGASGHMLIVTGNGTGSGASGQVGLGTGSSTTAGTGLLTLYTGDSTSGGTTGNITLITGATSGTRGNVQLDGLMVQLDNSSFTFYQKDYLETSGYWGGTGPTLVIDSTEVYNNTQNDAFIITTTDSSTLSMSSASLSFDTGANTDTGTGGGYRSGWLYFHTGDVAGNGRPGGMEFDMGASVDGDGAEIVFSFPVPTGTGKRGRMVLHGDSFHFDSARLTYCKAITTHNNGTPPTINVGAAAGTGGSVGATLVSGSSELGGKLTVVTGSSGLTTGTLVTVTYQKAFDAASWPVIKAANTNAGIADSTGQTSVTDSTTAFTIEVNVALAPNTTYVWNYVIVGH